MNPRERLRKAFEDLRHALYDQPDLFAISGEAVRKHLETCELHQT